MHYYFVASRHKVDLNLSHLCSLSNFLESFIEVWFDSANNGPPLLVGNHQVLNSGHSNGHFQRNHISELVELDELGSFFIIHLVKIVDEVGLFILFRPLFVESMLDQVTSE